MREKVTPRTFLDGTELRPGGCGDFGNGVVGPSYADMEASERNSSFLHKITRWRAVIGAGVLAGIGVGVFSALSGGTAEAADDTTPLDIPHYSPEALAETGHVWSIEELGSDIQTPASI